MMKEKETNKQIYKSRGFHPKHRIVNEQYVRDRPGHTHMVQGIGKGRVAQSTN